MQQSHPHPMSAVVYILAWIICSVLVLVDVLVVRQATLDVMTVVQMQQVENSDDKAATQINAGFVKEIVDRVLIITGGIVAISLALYFEHYFRKGRQQGKLRSRILKVGAILIAVFLISVAVQTLV